MRTYGTIALVGALSILPRMASADSDSDEELNKRFQEGKQFFADHKYGEARTRFLEACAVLKTANCPKNLALCEEQLSMWPDATAHLREWIDDPRTKDDHFRADMERKYLELRSRVGELDFLSTKEGARVRVDGNLVGTTPIMHAVFVPVGAHVIEAQWPLSVKKADVTIDAGKSLRIELSPDNVTATASAPVTPGMLPKGSEPKTETYRPTAGYVVPAVLAGLGLVGVGMGIGFGLASVGAKVDRDALAARGLCAAPVLFQCQAYLDKTDAINADSTLSIVGYVSGFTLLAASVVSFLVWPKHERTVTIVPQGLGFAVLGSF